MTMSDGVDERLLNQILRCDLSAQRKATHLILIVGVLIAAFFAVMGVLAQRDVYWIIAGAEFTAAMFICLGRYRNLKIYALVQEMAKLQTESRTAEKTAANPTRSQA